MRQQDVAFAHGEALDLGVGLRAHAEVEEVAVHLLVAEVLQRARPVVRRAVVEGERDPVVARVVDLMVARGADQRLDGRAVDGVAPARREVERGQDRVDVRDEAVV
jgi:hypothetical protein